MGEKLQVEVVTNFYRREDYSGLLAIFKDASHFPVSYDEWFRKFEHIENRIRKEGNRVVRVIIELDEFPKWCASQKLQINGLARSAFARFKARDVIRGRNN